MKFHKIKIFFSITLLLFAVTGCVSNFDIQKLNNKAGKLMSAGDVDGAIARLESINDLNPNFPQTNYNLGIAYYKKGNYEKAINFLDKAIKLKSDFAEAYYSLAVTYEDIAEDPSSKNNPNLQVDNLELAKQNYYQYLELEKDATDSESIKARIDMLDMEILKIKSGKY